MPKGWSTRFPLDTLAHIHQTYTLMRRLLKQSAAQSATALTPGQIELDLKFGAWLAALEQQVLGADNAQFDGANRSAPEPARTRAVEPELRALPLSRRITTAPLTDPSTVFDAMRYTPRPLSAADGPTTIREVDAQGHDLHTGGERYTILGHLLGSATPEMLLVSLPAGPITPYMLQRPIRYRGSNYLMHGHGGSLMKPGSESLSTILAGQSQGAAQRGRLYAVPEAAIAPGSPYLKLLCQLFPYQESYYYFQRMLMALPARAAASSGVDADCVPLGLKGSFRVMIFPDAPADQAHPFQLRGGIKLRPHDGCGFIKASAVKQLKLEQRIEDGGLQAYGNKRPANLPSQALQQYSQSRGKSVGEEASQRLKMVLEQKRRQDPRYQLEGPELFRTLTTGLIQGDIAGDVPAEDLMLHLPLSKSATFERHRGGVLLGRAPYPQPNLRPFGADQVRSGSKDATAEFLDTCTAVQYSFVAQDNRRRGKLSFAKGIWIVVPDKLWPKEYAEHMVATSNQDFKTDTDWVQAKRRVTRETALDCNGILLCTGLFAPGSLVAVPPAEQQKLGGDFDGDPVLVIADRPALWQHVKQQDDKRQGPGVVSFKPPKSHHSAFDKEGNYIFSRAEQICGTRLGVLGKFCGLQQIILARPVADQARFALRVMQELDAALTALPPIQGYDPRHRDKLENLHKLLSIGISMGTDAYKADTHIREFAEIADRLRVLLRQDGAYQFIPYAKNTAHQLRQGKQFDPQRASDALRNNPTLAAEVMDAILKLFIEVMRNPPAAATPARTR